MFIFSFFFFVHFRIAIISGGIRLRLNFSKTMLPSPSLFASKMDLNVTVSWKRNISKNSKRKKKKIPLSLKLKLIIFKIPSAIGRTLIPRYFRSIFEGGVTELYYHMKHPKESFHNTTITLDCENCVMVTHHGKPPFMKVHFLIIYYWKWMK